MPILTRTFLAIAVLSLAASATHAQFAVYGTGSGVFLGSGGGNSGFNAGGATVGVYDDFLRLGPLKLGADGRFFTFNGSNSNGYGNKLRGGLVGPRLALKLPLVPFKPYVQAEFGDVATNYGTLANLPNSFAYQIQGGLDFTVFPHLDLRGEYGGGSIHTYAGTQRQSLQEAGIGLVLRFF